MIILDEPFTSAPLAQWLIESQHPVLANAYSRALSARAQAGEGLPEGAAPGALNLVGEDEAARRLDAGERVYTNSENALAWILDHSSNAGLTDAIRLFKDKAALREKLAPLAPGLFFATLTRRDLDAVNVDDLPLPVVLKPAVGFCSMGVYVIEERDDWAAAVADIARHEDEWHARYPDSVVGSDVYLVEGYLTGTEYALDAYFDEEGRAHVLNVLRHDFAGPEDTSDRMYLTDAAIVADLAPRFTAWLDEVNTLVGARSIPVHVEVRVDGDAIVPIEFNPLRFAGLGGTDVAYYAVGLRTYEAFLEDRPVDVAALYAAHPGEVFSMSLLNPAPDADTSRPFDYDALAARFSHVLALVPFDPQVVGSYGFLFLMTDDASAAERDFLLHTDLAEFTA
ncbi:MAG: ATP-grasp domain-containing protein [Eggerthellaceae bacterium]|nr:ATP-grasp domain-containing protein [Eggerthellaceae bacterium]